MWNKKAGAGHNAQEHSPKIRQCLMEYCRTLRRVTEHSVSEFGRYKPIDCLDRASEWYCASTALTNDRSYFDLSVKAGRHDIPDKLSTNIWFAG
jgi:hypothetical protein